LIAAVNGPSLIATPLLSLLVPELRNAGFLRLFAVQVAAAAGASAFGFFGVAALQGLLVNLTTPRAFRRVSPWIQVAGLSVMILTLLLYPVYSQLLASAARANSLWLWLFPPVWFAGLYDLLLPHPDPYFAALGRHALYALAAAITLFCASWGIGFRRHYRRTLESEDTESRTPRSGFFDRLPAVEEERALFLFAGRILARSAKHRLFFAVYWSVGIALGILTTVAIRQGQAALSPDGLRSFPFLIAFFLISGFRAAFQFPADLPANWIFRMTELHWLETSRRATRKRVLASGLPPICLVFMPFEMAHWGALPGLGHVLLQLVGGALLIEVFFWNFDKVPFTCSYFSGKVNLALLAGVFIYGFTIYSFQMADLETEPAYACLFLAAAAGTLVWSWRRNPPATDVRFDGADPQIQTLNLS
jgi:hypothetical protein